MQVGNLSSGCKKLPSIYTKRTNYTKISGQIAYFIYWHKLIIHYLKSLLSKFKRSQKQKLLHFYLCICPGFPVPYHYPLLRSFPHCIFVNICAPLQFNLTRNYSKLALEFSLSNQPMHCFYQFAGTAFSLRCSSCSWSCS